MEGTPKQSNHERERIVIESSILAATLLFIVAGIRGLMEDASVLWALSLVGALFITGAVMGAMIMFFEVPVPLSALEIGFFIGGLVGLLAILFGIAQAGVTPLYVSMTGAVLFAIVAILGTVLVALENLKRSR